MIYAIFDTETTGLIANSAIPLEKQPRVIEFYGELWELKGDNWSPLRSLHSYINPGIAISDEVKRITGISQDMVENAQNFKAFLPSVSDFFSEAQVACAHNFSYDYQILKFEAQRAKQDIRLPPIHICTVEATEHLKGHRLNLMTLHKELFGEGFEAAHSAINDVKALFRCFKELQKKGIV
jgi:DNA polymerase III subunit alpha, Gram-positive type